MWPFLPKKCDCAETPTNPATPCNENLQVASDYVYNGVDLSCIGINHGDDLTTAIQKIDYYLCSREFTEYFLTYVENNTQVFADFIELVNGVINCETIQACGPSTTTTTSSTFTSSTTTTTTTLPCNCVEVFATNGDQVNYIDCNDVEQVELFVGTPSTIPPYVGANSKLYCAKSISVFGSFFTVNHGLCTLGSYCNPTTTTTTTLTPTTTTTSSSSTTTTSTSSSTTTTTTTISCQEYTAISSGGGPGSVFYIDCLGEVIDVAIENEVIVFCAIEGTVTTTPGIALILNGSCPT